MYAPHDTWLVKEMKTKNRCAETGYVNADAPKLDFIHLRGITKRIHKAIQEKSRDFYHIGLIQRG
jgi:hypothetical protein